MESTSGEASTDGCPSCPVMNGRAVVYGSRNRMSTSFDSLHLLECQEAGRIGESV